METNHNVGGCGGKKVERPNKDKTPVFNVITPFETYRNKAIVKRGKILYNLFL
jgi:hypothetical protein